MDKDFKFALLVAGCCSDVCRAFWFWCACRKPVLDKVGALSE